MYIHKYTGDYIYDTTCSKEAFQIKLGEAENYKSKSSFDCTALPVCEISCGGPDAAIVNSASKSCSCMGEWLLNSLVFKTALAVCVYVILNISRVLICKGAVMVLWRSLTLQEFEVKSTYSFLGKRMVKRDFLMIQKDKKANNLGFSLISKVNTISARYEDRLEEDECISLKETYTPCEKAMDDSIKRLVKVFVIKGYFYFITGCLINALWLAVLLQAQQNISYDPNK